MKMMYLFFFIKNYLFNEVVVAEALLNFYEMSLQKIRTSRLYHLPRYSIKQTPGKLVLLIVTNMTVLISKDVGVKSTIYCKKHPTT